MRRGSRVGGFVGWLSAAALLAACGTPAVPASPRSGSAPVPEASSTPVTPTPLPSSPAGTVHVVGLGDSVTAGANCDCDDYVTGFGHLLAARDGVRVRVTNHGEGGLTSDWLASELDGDRSLRSDVADAEVVVVTMGANDLYPALADWRAGSCPASCYGAEVDTMRGNLSRVLDKVDALRGGRSRVLATTYWNVFTDGTVARNAERSGYLAWSDAVTRAANAAIASVTAAHRGTVVDLYAPFKAAGSKDPTALLADDGDHPDEDGTALISAAVLDAYEGRA